MATHRLKAWPASFSAIYEGDKRAEFRKDDRGFDVDDQLILEEYDPATGNYSGRRMMRLVTHILRGPDFGVPEGYVVMSIR